MARFDSQFLETLKSRVNIYDVLSQYISLQKKGRDYWACCPFHHEKTPSFKVSVEYQTYKCFACEKSGNIITFLMDYDRMSYVEAVEFLAQKAGLEVPKQQYDEKEEKRKEEREKKLKMNSEAARFYYNTIKGEKGTIAREYLFNRGIDVETIKKFGIGYSPDYTSLITYFKDKGYSEQSIIDAGLAVRNKNGGISDFFGTRLIIPIINDKLQVVGFGGRVLESKGFAKYKNSSDSDVFNKRKNLFAINLVKQLKKERAVNDIIVVEGYMDSICLYQAGIKNSVAIMGTAFTVEQARKLKAYVDTLYISLDGDGAGQSATLRSLDLLTDNGLDVRVICIPDKLDPDEYIRKYGVEAYLELKKNALPLIDFKLKTIEDRYSLNSLDEKKKYVKRAIDEVLSTLDEVTRAVYAEVVSQKSGISTQIILEGVKSGVVATNKTPTRKDTIGESDKAERFVLSAILRGKPFATVLALDEKLYEKELHVKIVNYVLDCIERKRVPTLSDFYDLSEESEKIDEIIYFVDKVDENLQAEYFSSYYKQLLQISNKKELKDAIAALAKESDEERKKELKLKILELTKNQPKD